MRVVLVEWVVILVGNCPRGSHPGGSCARGSYPDNIGYIVKSDVIIRKIRTHVKV